MTRNVHDRHLERVAQFLFQLEEGRAVGHHRLVDRRFGRQQAELVRRAHHRALDEQAVDAARIVDRVDQAAAGLEVERQRAGAEMHVEVEQRGLAVGLFADRPGERGRDERRADPAAHADDRHQVMRLVVVHVGMFRRRQHRLRHGQRFADLVERQRFQKIVLNAARQKVAVQADVVHLARRDDHRARLADLGQRVDVVDRVARFGHVDEQDVRARRDRKRLDGVAQPALVALLDRPAHVGRRDADQLQRVVVADKGVEGVTQPCCFEWSVHLPPPALLVA